MDLEIKGRVAIVTGGSVGIGFAVAKELQENGVKLLIAARDQVRLRQAEQSLPDGDVVSIALDVADPKAAEQITELAINRYGKIDILVNNAGRAHSGGLMQSSEEDWTGMTDVKLTAMRRLCKAAIPHMQKQRWGRIVNMSSIGGTYPNKKLLISHVLSAAINNLTKALALEVAADGILVNAIGVGAVATENMTNNMIPSVRQARPEFAALSDEEVLARISAERTPIGRAGEPREIAAIAAFLASNRNGFVTGDTIEASGGAERFL